MDPKTKVPWDPPLKNPEAEDFFAKRAAPLYSRAADTKEKKIQALAEGFTYLTKLKKDGHEPKKIKNLKLPHTTGAAKINGINWSADGNRIGYCRQDHMIGVMDATKNCGVYGAKANWSQCIAMHPTRDVVLTGGMANAVEIWNPAAPGRLGRIGTLIHHDGYISSLEFMPDGAQFLSSSGDAVSRSSWHICGKGVDGSGRSGAARARTQRTRRAQPAPPRSSACREPLPRQFTNPARRAQPHPSQDSRLVDLESKKSIVRFCGHIKDSQKVSYATGAQLGHVPLRPHLNAPSACRCRCRLCHGARDHQTAGIRAWRAPSPPPPPFPPPSLPTPLLTRCAQTTTPRGSSRSSPRAPRTRRCGCGTSIPASAQWSSSATRSSTRAPCSPTAT